MSKPSLFSKKQEDLTLSSQALNELLLAFRERRIPLRFKVKGLSMSPFIKDGDVIIISPANVSTLRRGQIVAFSDPETKKVRVHRIIKKKQGYLLIKGDNTPWPDGYIPQKNVLGYVSSVERQGKSKSLGMGPERILISYLFSNAFIFSLSKIFRKTIGQIKKKRQRYG